MVWSIAVAILLTCPGAGASAAQQVGPPDGPLTAAERVEGLSTVWHQAIYNFPFRDRVPLERWDSAYRALVPEVLAAEDRAEYYRILMRFVAILGDGHSVVYPPASLREAGVWDAPPVSLRAVGRRAVVENVDRGLEGRLPVGSEIIGVDGRATEEVLRQDVFPWVPAAHPGALWAVGVAASRSLGRGLLVGPEGTHLDVRIVRPSGDTAVVRLERSRGTPEWARPVERRPILEHRVLEDDFHYVALNTLSDDSIVPRFDAIAEGMREARGLVLDLRRNGGGKIRLGVDLARRHLATSPMVGYAWRSRIHGPVFAANGEHLSRWFAEEHGLVYEDGELWFEAPGDTVRPDPNLPRLDMPVAVLIGPGTASSAESFVVLLESDPRFITVGARSYGSTGMGLRFDLPGGGFGQIMAERDTWPDGREFVGPGIRPDVPVEWTVDDVVRGTDPVLERALEVLRRETGG